jgi:hypothetical protein
VFDHPEIAAHKVDGLACRVGARPCCGRSRLRRPQAIYLHGVGPSRWLLAVVSYEQKPARIISVLANRKDPKTWSA